MATIHSLPLELVTHILTLAYDTSAPFSPLDGDLHQIAYTEAKAGLRAAALVHSSWREPAQKLMTAELHLGEQNPGVLERFLEQVPAGFGCARLELIGLRPEQLEALFGRARAGEVKGLRLFGRMPVGLFGLPALSELSKLKLGSIDLNMDPLPTTLTHLQLQATDSFPYNLIAASASTLTFLKLSLRRPSDLPLLAKLAPSLPNLRHLRLDCLESKLTASDYAADLERTAAHLPRLITLRLPPLWPALLEHVLRALPAGVALRRLRVEVVLAEPADDELARLEGEGGWLAGLERCASLGALSRLEEWDVGLGLHTPPPDPIWYTLDGDILADVMQSRDGQQERWDAFRARVAEAGIELLCWGRSYEELVELISSP